MKFALYSRKSVFTGKGDSIGNQIEMCRQHIFSKYPNANDGDITVFEDEGFSAKDTNRPRFQEMLAQIKQNRFDFLVCYRLDRISRSVADFSVIIEELNDRNVSFISIKENFDTSTHMGKAMLQIASVFAELERNTIAERVRDNMLMLARTGRWLGGSTPTGYVSEKVEEVIIDGKAKSSCKLKENADEIKVVDMIFDKYLELRSVNGVSKFLIKQGIKSRAGTLYSLPGIKDILQNPVYCTADADALAYFRSKNSDICFDEKDCSDKHGLLSYNKRDCKKKSAPRLSMDNWIIAIGKHKGRISGGKWVAVQNMLEADKPDGKRPAKMHNDYSLLSGLIYCECGNRMFAKAYTGKNSTGLFSYLCNHKLRGGVGLCDSPNLQGKQTDDIVCEYLKDYLKPTSGLCQHLDKLKAKQAEGRTGNPLADIDVKIKKVNAQIDNLVNTLSETELVPDIITRVNKKIAEFNDELDTLTKEKNRLAEEQDGLLDSERQLEFLFELLASFKNNFNNLSIHDKRTLIKMLVEKITWDGRDLHIFTYGG